MTDQPFTCDAHNFASWVRDTCPHCNDDRHGPQRQPASVGRIEAQRKAVEKEIRFRCSKVLVFSGNKDQAREFIRCNRFTVLLSGMELRDMGREVWAWRNDHSPPTKGSQ